MRRIIYSTGFLQIEKARYSLATTWQKSLRSTQYLENSISLWKQRERQLTYIQSQWKGEGMEPAREGDQLREDFLEALVQNILLDIKLAVSSSIHEAVQKSPPLITSRHTHINEKILI